MQHITTISTKTGKIYIDRRDKSKLDAYSRRLSEYERMLLKKYGKDFTLLITPAEYKKTIKLHNAVNRLIQRVKRNQATLKKQDSKK